MHYDITNIELLKRLLQNIPADVEEIRKLRSDGGKLLPIGQKFGIAVSTVSQIVNRKHFA